MYDPPRARDGIDKGIEDDIPLSWLSGRWGLFRLRTAPFFCGISLRFSLS